MQPYSGICGASGGACIPNPRVALRRHRRAQPHLSHHRRQSGQLSRQAAHRRQHRLHPGNHHLPQRRRHAGRQRRGPPAGRKRQPALSVHGELCLRLLLQRQPRQPRHRLGRPERQPAHDVGIERRRAAGLLRPERHPSAAGHDHRQLPGHLRAHRPHVHSRQLGRSLS